MVDNNSAVLFAFDIPAAFNRIDQTIRLAPETYEALLFEGDELEEAPDMWQE